tara:strand:+ start:1444 stop:2427 length:984 start_codon:yes stop_codon:yes gene_type:complete
MSSIYSAFCNNHSDLKSVVSDIDRYDRKAVLNTNWKTTSTTNLYELPNSGYVEQAFKDGAELTMVTDAPNADNEARYVSTSDSLFYFLASSSVSALNSAVFESGQDWDALKSTVCKEQADMMRSYLNRPIYKKLNSTYQGASERSYDFIVVRINSILACADLVRSSDPEKADAIEALAINGDGNGLLDKLKRREYVMSNETSFASEKGVIQEISVHANTTGYIEDIKLNAPPSVDYDEVRVVISTGGTFAVGTASPVKYDVYVKDDTGIRMSKVVSAEQMSGDYQQLAYGAQIRFQAGVYTQADEFAVIFQSSEIPVGTVKSGQIYR